MGVEVMEVVADSPAARTGFLPGDIILEVDGIPIEDVADLQRLMVGESLGGPLRVLVWRGADTRTIEVQPAELDAA
jgi:serine protease Do